MKYVLIILLLVLPAGIFAQIFAGSLETAELMALRDMQRFTAEAGEQCPQLVTERLSEGMLTEGCIVFGTPSANYLVKKYVPEAAGLGKEDSLVVSRTVGGRSVTFICGSTARGSAAAVYSYLRQRGFRFFMGSYSVPETLQPLPDKPIIQRNLFSVRGTNPYYNFFNSPTAWNETDWRAYIDMLVRSGANTMLFHVYDGEPFAAFRQGDGSYRGGSRLLATDTSTWGTLPAMVSDYAFGTDKLYHQKAFGADTTEIEDDNEAIEAEQKLFARAMEYARMRGVYTCIGFEMLGDPINDSRVREDFVRKLNAVMDTYPSLDYIVLWQAETQGAQGFPRTFHLHNVGTRDPNSPLLDYGLERKKLFRHIVSEVQGAVPFYQNTSEGEVDRACEGARLEQFAYLALNQLAKRKNAPGLVLSGWGGDNRLLSAEYYEGLDKLLPQSVVFSSLDNISIVPKVDTGYGLLKKKRQRWPIVWLECDGDQWQDQPHVHTLEQTLSDAAAKGCQGILGIHWRTRDVERDMDYILRRSENSTLSAEEYFDALAGIFPKGAEKEYAAVLSQLDSMGYRWVGGGGQNECAYFTWGPGGSDKITELEGVLGKVDGLIARFGTNEQAEYLRNRIDWTLKYTRAEQEAAAGKITNPDLLKDAVEAYTRRITTRGEYGVLATINTKAVPAWRALTDSEGTISEPGLIFPSLPGSICEGEAYRLMFIYPHEASASLVTEFGRVPLTVADTASYVKYAEVPAPLVRGSSIHIAVKAGAEEAHKYITVMPSLKTSTVREQLSAPKAQLKLRVVKGDVFRYVIKWNTVKGADWYRVTDEKGREVITAVPMFPCPGGGKYTVEAAGVQCDPASADVPAAMPKTAIKAKAEKTASGVKITVEPSSCRSIRSEYVQGDKAVPIDEILCSSAQKSVLYHRPEIGTAVYRLTPILPEGIAGQSIDITCTVDSYTELKEVLRIEPQTAKKAEGDTMVFDGEYFTVPHNDYMDISDDWALSLDFCADSTAGMPVLLSKGLWQSAGWFLQILDGRLLLRTPKWDFEGPQVETGRWYNVRFIYQSGRAEAYIDGSLVHEIKYAPAADPMPGNLTLGMYNSLEPQFVFRGKMKNIVFCGIE